MASVILQHNGGHDNFFALWPIYFNQTTGIGTDNPEKIWVRSAVLPAITLALARFDLRDVAVFQLD